MKQIKKLDSVNKKLEALISQKREIENEMINTLSKKIAALLIKQRSSKIDRKQLLQKIDLIINQFYKAM